MFSSIDIVNFFISPTFIIVLSLLGLFSIVNQVIYFTYFWQLKEYRLDRMRDFLSTKSGRDKFFPIFWKIKLVLVLLFVVFLFAGVENLLMLEQGTVFILLEGCTAFSWLYEIGDFLWRFKNMKIYRPEKTFKALLIVILTLVTLLFIFSYGFYIPMFSVKSLILLFWLSSAAVIIVNSLVVLVFWPVTLLSKKRALFKASKKLAKQPNLKVVGITGSYGKSSAKEFLAAILERKFNVLKTPGNINTDIGVAGVVIKDLKPEHEVFIVEAGAYKIGEIKKIVDLVKPRIGIITAVKDAHLGLFGSLENIKKAKFELIEGLPEFGTAIFNIDSEGAGDLAQIAEQRKLSKVIRYSAAENSDSRRSSGKAAGLIARHIEVEKEKLSFELDGVKFELNVCGSQNVYSALAAIATARELGIDFEEMVEPLRSAKLRDHTMSLKKANQDLWLIDDTYNANPDGVIAGLEYLRQAYSDWQKIIVFPGMLELGRKSSEEHQRVAKKIAQVCDSAIFTSRDFEKEILLGIKDAGEMDKLDYQFVEGNQKAVLADLRKKASGRKTVILFSSRGAEQVIKGLL